MFGLTVNAFYIHIKWLIICTLLGGAGGRNLGWFGIDFGQYTTYQIMLGQVERRMPPTARMAN